MKVRDGDGDGRKREGAGISGERKRLTSQIPPMISTLTYHLR